MKLDLGSLELGVATAATQIEGGDADTNWHRWAATPGRILDGSTPARATDHWNRVEQDIELLRELGIRHYRMGLEWARIEPAPAEFSTEALDHYADELRRLRDAGIKPLVTLHHFNNPEWLEQTGAFVGGHAVGVFERYVRRVVDTLGPLVDEWITVNEPNVYATNGYLTGVWPPGHKSMGETLAVMQHLAEAHIRAYRIIHHAYPNARVGVANHLRVFRPANPFNPVHQVGARLGEYLFQTAITHAMSVGRFLPPFRQPAGVRPGQYYDFQGINYYSRSTVKGLADGMATGVPVNDLGWEVYPEGLAILARKIASAYPGPIYVTENGTADAADAFRALYVYEHVKAAVTSGAPVERYYHWCFTDNWEWAEGESARFGLVALDYETQARTVRDSGRFYADVAVRGGVTEDAYRRWVAACVYPRG